MKPEYLIPFDPAIVPWHTTPNEWALCIVPEPDCRVWIEHALIREMLVADQFNPDVIANVHGMFTTIGGKVAAEFVNSDHVLKDGKVWQISFIGNSTDVRVGFFGDELFVFLPRVEFE